LGFSALSDILKADAGILDSDDVAAVEEKLEQVLPEGENRLWLRQRLRPLLGLEGGQASREESFAAWTLVLRHISSAGPTILVFEDLHWAGEGMLAFVEHLAAEALETPLLLVGTARPELLQCHPDLLAPTARIARLVLSPLSRKDAALLVSSLLDERLAAEVRKTIIERVGGNPLYAEEYVRLLLDRGLLRKIRGVLQLKESEELPLPDTVQAVLAARLDTLTPDHKALLCDAAVFGESFWAGGVAALAECSATEVEAAMAALAERQLVRAVVSSSLASESEYLFWHALARDVAYGELPRRVRARKHQSAALWIEQQAGDRTGDVSQVLAHHFVTALDLARATGEHRLAGSLLDPAVRYLELAGNLIIDLDATTTERYFTRALELVSNDAAERPRLLASWGIAVDDQGRLDESAAAFDEAIPGLLAGGERRKAAYALIYLSSTKDIMGRPGAEECTAQALALLEGDDPSPESVFVLFNASIQQGNLGHLGRAKALAERAVAAAEGCEPIWQARALSTRGASRCDLGDGGGLADMRTSRDVAVAEGYASSIVIANYALKVFSAEGPAAALPISRDHLSACRTQGMRRKALEARRNIFEMLCANGSWEEALADAAQLARDLEEIEDVEGLIYLRASLVILLARRGESDGSGPQIDWLLEAAQEMEAPAALAASTIAASTVCVIVDQARARGLLETLVGSIEPILARQVLYEWIEALRVAHAIGAAAIAERMTTWVEPLLPVPACARRYADALLAEHHGQLGTASASFADAAVRWHDFGVPYEEAQALLGQGRCLMALSKAPEAAVPLAEAREIFERLGAKPALAETDELLSGITSA
jgi:tetratricopeptide (TPR) repeat protein